VVDAALAHVFRAKWPALTKVAAALHALHLV
jgi:hypothetical protein